jgi:formate hydrogenlyase subunit 7
LALRVAVEREARRMAGYRYGKRIAETFMELYESEPKQVEQAVQAYLAQQEDPRLTEILTRLVQVYQSQGGAA